VSTTLYIGQVIVSTFACGKCRENGPCFQFTALAGGDGDYAVVHRREAPSIVAVINAELGTAKDVKP